MNCNYTKGNWKQNPDNLTQVIIHRSSSSRPSLIARCVGLHAKANARLISAAPDMLLALDLVQAATRKQAAGMQLTEGEKIASVAEAMTEVALCKVLGFTKERRKGERRNQETS